MTHDSRRTYSELTAAIAQSTRAIEDALPLRNEFCRTQLMLQKQRPKRVCIWFHGFTAGPYQFVPMGKVFFNAGYTVLIPRLPGHGQAGNWDRQNPPPLPLDRTIYQQFALDWLAKAQQLGDEVVVGGLSAGGTLAAWLALERPQSIQRACLFAAYLSGSSKLLDLFVKRMNTYFEWMPVSATPSVVYGYKGFPVPAMRVFLEMGKDILDRAPRVTAPPMFIVSSESDIAVGNFDHRDLFEKLLPRQPMTWYNNLPKALEIPHTMTTQLEGNRWENVLNTMAKAFVESRLTWAEVEEIGHRMTMGKTFNQVVAELGLAAKASPDMPAMMTMVDKRAIALKRNVQRPSG
jgi:pimeloyl-ACP methyl ester carboxylesterase